MGNDNSKPAKKTITKTDIQTYIQTEINNNTQNITDIVTKTINDTTMSVINKNATAIDAEASATNNMELGNLNATGTGTEINISQTATVNAIVKATVNLISDSKALSALGSQMTTDLKNKVANDNAMSQSMDAINKIVDAQKSSGGPEALVDSVMSTIAGLGDSLSGAKSESAQLTMIKNSLNAKISNTTVNKNSISNLIENKVKTNLENINEQSCKLNAEATNNLKLKDINAASGGVINFSQSAVVTAALDCIMSAVNASSIGSDIKNALAAGTASDSSNTNKTDTAVKTENDVSKTTEKGSAIMDTVDTAVTTAGSVTNNAISTGGMLVGMWFLIPICCICCCCLVVFALLYMMNSGTISAPSVSDLSTLSELSSSVSNSVSKFK